MSGRIKLFTISIFIGFVLIIGRLFYWQVVKGAELALQASYQYKDGETLRASRGEILASDSSWLVARETKWLLYADMTRLTEIDRASNLLAPILLEDDKDIDEDQSQKLSLLEEETARIYKLLNSKSAWVPIKSRISSEKKAIIENLNIEGLGFQEEESRYYPESSVAAHLTGFVGKNELGEDEGYFGLEGYYNLSLSGRPGFISRETDASGSPIVFGKSKSTLPLGGVDLVTHINKSLQITAEKKLYEGLKKYGASAGSVIIMDPKNGAILTIASLPSYEQERYFEWGNSYFVNPVVSNSFEPGSIFKVVVMASGLDAEVVSPDTKCDICNGPVQIGKYSIKTWNQQYYPDSTMLDVIVHSDNTGMVFVAKKLGAERLYDYLSKFGIGQKTGIDLQGEMSPLLREKSKWSEIDVATASFGQGIAVTPIQMIRAVSVLANDGYLVTPQVVNKLKKDTWEENIDPIVSEKVISEEAANEITAMMVEAAKKGEAKWTHLTGFGVAGKTGTAQIPVAGKYDEENTIASFVGFAPYNDPKFVMLVTLKKPQSSPWASETAAPLWYDIARDVFLHLGVQPSS